MLGRSLMTTVLEPAPAPVHGAERMDAVPPQAPGAAGAPPQFLVDAAAGFAAGGHADVVKGNVIFTRAQVVRRFMLMFFPRVFGMLLLGFYIGRRNLLRHRLRLFGRVPIATALAGGVVFFLLQTVASKAWLTVAAFGPAEWLWRMYTYRRRVPLFRR